MAADEIVTERFDLIEINQITELLQSRFSLYNVSLQGQGIYTQVIIACAHNVSVQY